MTHDYVLRGGRAGAERLQLLARVKWPTTEALFRQAGLREGMRCLDVGCGIGAVTLRLAEWVGPRGQAVGMDLDEEALVLGRHEASQRGLAVVFHAGTVASLNETSAYDLVYARFLLSHLANRAATVTAMAEAARPGVCLREWGPGNQVDAVYALWRLL